MSLFDKFKALVWQKGTTQKSIDLLTSLLKELSERHASYDGIHAHSIASHIMSAEHACKASFESIKVDDTVEASHSAKEGLIHLHIADLLMNGSAPAGVELNVPADTIEGALNDLIQRIAKVKLTVEYGDLLVTIQAQEALINVIKIFDETSADLKKSHLSDAKRGAAAALVALHWTICILEASNPEQSLSNLKISSTEGSPAEKSACDFAEQILSCKSLLGESIVDPEVAMHLFEAEKKFANCLENLIDGDERAIMLDCKSGALDLQLASKAALDSNKSKERRKDEAVRQSILEFKQAVSRVLKLAEQLDVDNRALDRRLQDTEYYFVEAHKRLQKNDLHEAERLARAAHLDLDFSWQIANAIRKATYRNDI